MPTWILAGPSYCWSSCWHCSRWWGPAPRPFGVCAILDQTDDNEQQAKAKRTGRSRVERLIEALDDDEIYDLELLLRSREDSTRRKE